MRGLHQSLSLPCIIRTTRLRWGGCKPSHDWSRGIHQREEACQLCVRRPNHDPMVGDCASARRPRRLRSKDDAAHHDTVTLQVTNRVLPDLLAALPSYWFSFSLWCFPLSSALCPLGPSDRHYGGISARVSVLGPLASELCPSSPPHGIFFRLAFFGQVRFRADGLI